MAFMDMFRKKEVEQTPTGPDTSAMPPRLEKPKIGREQIAKAYDIMQKYKSGKAHLEAKLRANEEFWKLRQWETVAAETKDWRPHTPWLWSCIQSRHADIMDNYPTCNLKARQRDDIEEAKKLSAIVPVVLENNRFEQTFFESTLYALKNGAFSFGVFWDGQKHGGLGDVSIKKIDLMNLFWKPGITNIQDSPHVFLAELVDNEILKGLYPQLEDELGKNPVKPSRYLYDESIDTSGQTYVIDWYYKRSVNGRTVLHYCKFVGQTVLYASENETARPTATVPDPVTGIPQRIPVGPSMAERGFYDHGKYPFVITPLFPVEGSICGYSLTDIGRDTQVVIDKLHHAVAKNAVFSAQPRVLAFEGSGINEEEFCDPSASIVHVKGGKESVEPLKATGVDGNILAFLQYEQEMLKFATSNTDVNNGIPQSGVTAGSAIAALQESSGKNARNSNKTIHRGFREGVYLVIEVIRQFYDTPRQFRIAPDSMEEEYVEYSNARIRPQQQFGANGQALGYRIPEFDIEVTSEKANPYKKMEYNELSLNLYRNGFYNPQMTDQALAALELMDFDHKDRVVDRISQNGTMQSLLIQYQRLALQLAQRCDPLLADRLAQTIMQQGGAVAPPPRVSGETEIYRENTGRASGEDPSLGQEHPNSERARKQARESTQAE